MASKHYYLVSKLALVYLYECPCLSNYIALISRLRVIYATFAQIFSHVCSP